MAIVFPGTEYAAVAPYVISATNGIIFSSPQESVMGSIALYPSTASSIIGSGGVVSGSQDAAGGPGEANALNALQAIEQLYNLLIAKTGAEIYDLVDEAIIMPGVYNTPNLNVSGTVILDGGPGSQYFFVSTGLIEFAAGTSILIPNGVYPWDIFWVAEEGIIVDSSSIPGIMMSNNTATMNDLKLVGAIFAATVTTSGLLTNINLPSYPDPVVPCYFKGTLILTEKGYVPIENIKFGDKVQAFAKIKSSTDVVKHDVKLKTCIYVKTFKISPPTRETGLIAFLAGSLGDNLPTHNLYLSPNHGVLVDNYMVAAKDMVNDSTIFHELSCQDIDYYHIQLDSHSCIKANGVLAESLHGGANKLIQ
jgi:hypothetical protein